MFQALVPTRLANAMHLVLYSVWQGLLSGAWLKPQASSPSNDLVYFEVM